MHYIAREASDWGRVIDEQVVLLAPDGTPAGSDSKHAVHHHDTPLHLAFSCHVLDADGRVLLTRRALGKQTWPGVWTNSFCGHPAPGEEMVDAVRRRARYELGIDLADVRVVLPGFRYRAVDASGIAENEVCPVFRARIVGVLDPDSDEVCEYVWEDPGRVHSAARLAPWVFSPWFVAQLEQMGPSWAG